MMITIVYVKVTEFHIFIKPALRIGTLIFNYSVNSTNDIKRYHHSVNIKLLSFLTTGCLD